MVLPFPLVFSVFLAALPAFGEERVENLAGGPSLQTTMCTKNFEEDKRLHPKSEILLENYVLFALFSSLMDQA